MTDTFEIVKGVGVIGGRPIERAEVVSKDLIGRFHTRQILCKFLNGWKLSVVFGTATYSSNRDWNDDSPRPPATHAEIAIFSPTEGMVDLFGWGDTVLGNQTTDDVWGYIDIVERYEPEASA